MTGNNYRYERLLRMVDKITGYLPEWLKWIDLGCHQGQFLKLVNNKCRIMGVGVDVWDTHEKSPDHSWYFYEQCDMENESPFSDYHKFDVVSALEVIEHITDTDKFLSDIHAHMTQGGFLLISTPNISCLRNRVMGLFGVYPVGLEYRNVIHHVRLYNPEKLREHLAEHGFKVLAMTGVNFLPYKYLDNKFVRKISEWLADRLPSLCNNLILVATAV